MKRILLLTILLLSSALCPAVEPSDISLARNNSFTGRGNTDEPVLKIKVASGQLASLKRIKLAFSAEKCDISSAKLMMDGKIVSSRSYWRSNRKMNLRVRNRSAATDADSVELVVAVDVRAKATEGGKVSADVVSMKFGNTKIVPEAPAAGAREILLCRKCLFKPGDYGSLFWRIPAVRQLQDGTLLVVNDRRNKSEGDLPGEIDVVSRYSTDRGHTWSEPVYVARNNGPAAGYGDPALVELEDGTVLCMFCGAENFTKSTWENPQRSYYSVSKDHGRTWSEPVDVTARIWGPDPANPFCKRYHSSFFTSGNSLILTHGAHKGRILTANVTTFGTWADLCNHAVYSDDGGKTWNVSELAFGPGADEAKMVQLNDGRILMSIRQRGERAYVISEDDGQTWGEAEHWSDMNVTNCNGDLIRYDENTLLHTIPYSMKRENVSVLMSFDEGKTWPERKTICAGPSQYSSITVLDDGTIGAYIEENRSGVELWFENFSMEWLRSKDK